MRNPFVRPASPERAIERQLRQIERQGSWLAIFSHLTSFALVIVFSAGSLIALAGEAFGHFLTEWRSGVIDIPALISFVVSFLLVVCMNLALLVAAGAVRMLLQRRQSGVWLHAAVIVGISLVEASTYFYMSWLYDHPATLAAWLLIGARSLAAPLTAVYLSLTRTLPIGARDILYQVELVTARGVIADMTQIASDTSATTERKLALYQASGMNDPADDARLSGLIAAARLGSPAENIASQEQHYTAEQAIAAVRQQLALAYYPPVVEADEGAVSTGDNDELPPEPPHGGGGVSISAPPPSLAAPSTNVTPLRRRPASQRATKQARLVASEQTAGGGTTPARRKRVRTPRRKGSGGQSLEATARAAWVAGAHSVNLMVAQTGMSRNAAGGWVRTLKAEQLATALVAAQEGA